ncbi:uncharacterized protein PGRI_061580 [Penicillium griseofulvum]|uniref:Pathogen-related protein n=1 Tax=Penicillium patulum TaxID=5078 RepID=A0A135LMK3_PENPA|nr:uncharacterized protein PGRI_061580 [Penicillium griseofulvum]KXG50191.1 hypothetical protein PGRI_061580 [Penicillium griseofulvum]
MSELPDYVLDSDAVLKDISAAWRHGNPPDYSKTRAFYEKTKTKTHEPGSLPFLVENLVKNWEIEASFKTNLSDWRTIDHDVYTVSVNGGERRTGHHMLEVGTYNALLTASQYYDPAHNDFNDSHKSFKRMMPTFAWEVLEVYSGPPVVAFRWRHWGEMKNDYVGNNSSGEKVKIEAHGGPIDIEGVVVAKVNDKLQVQSLDIWYDPMAMFRQISKEGQISSEGSGSGCPFVQG